MKTTFTLSDKEEKKLNKWKKAIYEIYGEYGSYSFRFTPTGIGDVVHVHSTLIDKEIELTDYASW